MLSHLERPTERPPGLRQIFSDFGPTYASNGFIGWLFAATAPVAIILSVGSSGNLSEGEIASWIFAVVFHQWSHHHSFLLALPAAAGILLDDSGHGSRRPVADHLTFPRGDRRILRDGPADVVAWRDRLGEARHAACADADRHGHGGRRFPAFWPRPRTGGTHRHGNSRTDGRRLAVADRVPAFGRRMPPIIGALIVGALAISCSAGLTHLRSGISNSSSPCSRRRPGQRLR